MFVQFNTVHPNNKSLDLTINVKTKRKQKHEGKFTTFKQI